MSDLDDLMLDYRAAFLQYLPRRAESALALGYEIGRRALTRDVSLLDLTQVHHQVVGEVLEQSNTEESSGVVDAASEFLREVLSTFDMTRREIGGEGPGDRSAPGDATPA